MSRRYKRGSDGPPRLLIFLIAIVLVFGVYFVGVGVRNYFRTGGLGVIEATQLVEVVASATSVRATQSVQMSGVTPRPTSTPIPDCQDFRVTAANAIVREAPSSSGTILTQYSSGDIVCVVGVAPESTEWYLIDTNPNTNRLEPAYMHESIIEAVNPTPRPSRTPSPLPTVTQPPTLTPSDTPTRQPTATRDSRSTDTPTPTDPPTPTALFINA